MIRSFSWVLALGLLGVVAVVGCGSSASDSTDDTTSGGSGGAAGSNAGAAGVAGDAAGAGGGLAGTGGAGGSASDDIVGSYDLTFGAVAQEKMPLGQKPSSPGTSARLDIRAMGGSYEAVVTPRFGAPAPMTVQVTATTVVLDGSAVVSGDSFGSAVDSWKTFSLGRKPSGGLDGQASLAGDETAYAGDTLESTHITGVATIGPDVTSPALRLVQPSALDAPGSILPWDAIEVKLSEGIRGSSTQPVDSAIEVRDAGQALATVAMLSPAGDAPGGWAGVTALALRLASWDSGSATLDVTRAQPLIDPSGNASGELGGQVKVLGVPSAQPSHGFDTDIVTTRFWGHSQLLGGGLTGQHDPLCEAGGCLAFGPMDMGYCAKETAGVAARVTVTGATKTVDVRFRVMAAEAVTSLSALQVKVVSHGGTTSYASSMVTLAQTNEDSALPYTSPWSTLPVPLPAGASGEVGVVVAAGVNTGCGFTPPPTFTRVLVESIAAH